MKKPAEAAVGEPSASEAEAARARAKADRARAQRQASAPQGKASERKSLAGKVLTEAELIERIGEPDRREWRATTCVLPSGGTYPRELYVWVDEPTSDDPQARTIVAMAHGGSGIVTREAVR